MVTRAATEVPRNSEQPPSGSGAGFCCSHKATFPVGCAASPQVGQAANDLKATAALVVAGRLSQPRQCRRSCPGSAIQPTGDRGP
jgi:hypothetical protein